MQCSGRSKTFIYYLLNLPGSTWTQHIVSLLKAGEENYKEVSQIAMDKRVFFLEHEPPSSNHTPALLFINKMPPPRVDFTHVPYHFANGWIERDKVKTIVLLRNPKDTMVSLYHFNKDHAGNNSKLMN